MKPGFRSGPIWWCYSTDLAVGKMATFVLIPSPLCRLNFPAIPTARNDFSWLPAVYLEPGECHSKHQ